MKVGKELIGAGRQRTDIDFDLAAAGDDLLAMEIGALELFDRGIEILDDDDHLGVRGDRQVGR